LTQSRRGKVYGVLGEDPSDVEMVRVLIRRIADNKAVRVSIKGYEGCAQMLRKGATQLVLFRELGCKWFIVVYDADGPEWQPRYREVLDRIVKPSGVQAFAIIIPVQEIEAWVLADVECASRIFTGWRPDSVPNPENITNPKEYLERLSRASDRRPRYAHATHNPRIAEYLDLAKVARKCISFAKLVQFVDEVERTKRTVN
jgi:hypothetical protein